MTVSATKRRRALTALLLLAPVPSLGVLMAMTVAPGPIGKSVFAVAKIWLLVFPAAWYLLIEKGSLSWSPIRRGGLAVGAASGLLLAVAIMVAARFFGVEAMDFAPLHAAVREMGLDRAFPYLAAAAGWTFVNSLIEEYVYRWFVLRQCEALIGGPVAAVASSVIFTAHHIIAVSCYLEPTLAALASLGVFAAALVWSALYLRYRSIWPCWLSHVLADVAVFSIGWRLLFG